MTIVKSSELRRELTVGEVAERSGVAVSTLHFYEAKGLIRSNRTRGNQRRYPRSVLRRVAVIKVAQRTGIPLSEIQDALSVLPDDRPLTVEDIRASMDDAPATFRVQAAVAEFAELLRGSTWAEEGSYGAVLTLLENAQADLPENNEALNASVAELIELVQAAVRFGDR